MQSTHWVWDGDPIMFTIPEFGLPFAINLLALVAGYFGYQYVSGKQKTDNGKRFLIGLGIAAAVALVGPFLPGPVFESVGPISPRWYGLLFALSFFLGYRIGANTFKDAGLPMELPDKLFLYLMVGTVLGARLGHVIFYDLEYYLRHPERILMFWEGGLASHGAVIGVTTSIWLFVKKHPKVSFLWVADRMVLPFTLGGFFVRFGNFFNSEILGKPTELPWAVVFARIDALPRHPSMLYEAFWYLGAWIAFTWLYKKYEARPPAGSLSALFLLVLFVGRFLIEFTKEDQSAFEAGWVLNMGQILSLVAIAVGGWWATRINWKQPA